MGTEIVTRLYLDISISRHPLSAIAIPSRTLSAPCSSPQLHHATSRRSRGSIRKHLAGHDDGHPIAMIGEDAVLPRLDRHDERRTFALEKGFVHRQDVQIERFHSAAPSAFSPFRALRRSCRRCRTRSRADRRPRRRRSNITHSILPKRTACRSVLLLLCGGCLDRSARIWYNYREEKL